MVLIMQNGYVMNLIENLSAETQIMDSYGADQIINFITLWILYGKMR